MLYAERVASIEGKVDDRSELFSVVARHDYREPSAKAGRSS
jgi:hypothetical protein